MMHDLVDRKHRLGVEVELAALALFGLSCTTSSPWRTGICGLSQTVSPALKRGSIEVPYRCRQNKTRRAGPRRVV